MTTIHTQQLSNFAPKRGDEIADEHGVLRCMAVIDGYVTCRRPGCMPVVISIEEWVKHAATPVQLPASGASASPSATVDEEMSPVRYRHYKGGLYSLVCEAKLESDPGITMIIYRAGDGSVWARPSNVFFELVEVDGKKVPRFSPA